MSEPALHEQLWEQIVLWSQRDGDIMKTARATAEVNSIFKRAIAEAREEGERQHLCDDHKDAVLNDLCRLCILRESMVECSIAGRAEGR